MNHHTNNVCSENGTQPTVQKQKRDDMLTSDERKVFDYTFEVKDVSLQGQGTRTSNCATFGELPSEIVQINWAERRD